MPLDVRKFKCVNPEVGVGCGGEIRAAISDFKNSRPKLSLQSNSNIEYLHIVTEERAMRKPADQMIAPVLFYKSVFPHAVITAKSYSINTTMLIS